MNPVNSIRMAVKSIIQANSELAEKTRLCKRTTERAKKSVSRAIEGIEKYISDSRDFVDIAEGKVSK